MDTNLRFEFNVDQVNTNMEALVRMPYGQVAALITELQKQAQAQIGDGSKTMVSPPPAGNKN